MNHIYAGIGSRATPSETLGYMQQIGQQMAEHHWLLRSGGADGADTAFEYGCDWANGAKEIFLPWPGFNGNDSKLTRPSEEAYEIAAQFHPAWNKLSSAVRHLMARNVHQIAGEDLKTPVTMVICWTPGGSGKGGTGQALRMASYLKIPIIDLGDETLTIAAQIARINEILGVEQPKPKGLFG